jgi:hypothetical protein
MEFSLQRLIGRFSLFFSAILFTALNFNDAFAQGAGKALEFNGTNQSVSIPPVSSLDVTSAMTLEAWMKTTGENWNYTVPISFNPATPEADYQVKIELTTSNFAYTHANSDGSDIRFYDGNGTELNYWIEKWDASDTSIIWVKVPTAGTTEIFMYYGNSSAQAASNATNTFVRVINGNSPLKGSWHFDEGSGTTAYDNSGNGNNGTLYNSPAWVDGKFGKALSFDGSNDYVTTPIVSNILTDFTMEAWVKAPSVPGDRRIVMGSGWNYNDWYIGVNLSSNTGAPARKWLFWVAGNSQIAYLAAPDEIVAGAWYYLVATYEGTTGKFYINGNYIGSFTFTRKTDTNPFQIGRSYNGEYFNGLVDEVRIYNRALTSEEVSDLYQNYGYTTTNASGKVFVRKFSTSEPASTVGSEISMADIIGISKVDAYGIGVNSTAAFASINNQTISSENFSFKYKRQITFTPATSVANYQLKIELNATNFDYSKAKADGSDIRFYDANDIELNYWIENWNTLGTSTLWVKVPTIGTDKIYIYYGNPSASKVSSGSATFDFFDDFEDGNYDGWTSRSYETDDVLQMETDHPLEGAYSLKLHQGNSWGYVWVWSPFISNPDILLKVKAKQTGYENMDKGSGMGFVVLYYNDAETLLKALVWPVYTTTNPETHYEWTDNASNSERVDDWNLADSQVGERELNVSEYKPDGAIKIKIKAIIQNVNVGDFWVDLFRVRKYSTSEPTVTIGDEIASGMFSSSGWNHIAQTYDGSTQKLYLNGFLVASQPLSGEITANANDLLIGNMFNGTIDEVRLWNVARTEEEIRANMCKKLNGNEIGLVGYWRLDEGSGTTTNDATSNSNNGTLVNSPSWVWSGTAIGDESAYDYDGTNPEDFTVNLAHSAGDDITATGDGGTVKGIQVYRVDANSMRDGSTKPDDSWTMDPLRYWGVFITGTNPTYKLIYNYSGHPDITDANDLDLAKRDNLSDNSWDDAAATLITEAGTLTLTGQNGGEYALGSKTGANPLPVELTSFTASIADNAVSLKWHTATEVDNHGFEIERRGGESEEWIMVGFVEGKGTSNAPSEYSYQDTKVGVGKYEYRLKQIDNSGAFKYTGSVEVEISAPKEYALHQNYPNPFNPVTKISYEIPVKSQVTLKVYDMLGREVAKLYEGEREAGRYEAEFNGMRFSSGVYFYKLEAGSYTAVKKLLLVK